MTGNSVVLATTLLQPSLAVTGLSLLALLGFCGGAAAGALVTRSPSHDWSVRTSVALGLAGLAVLGCAAAIAASGEKFLPVIIAVTAAAMGLQSAAVQQLAIPGVSTVFVTGTLTTAIARLVGATRSATRIESHWLPALTWLGYFAGAAVGGLHRVLHWNFLLAVPGLLLLVVAVAGARSRR